MKTRSFRKIIGEIESDETLIGGKARNMHKDVRKRKITGTGASGKAIIQGLLERGIRAMVVPDQRRKTLQGNVRSNVTPGASVYSDSLASYIGLDADYIHAMVDHAVAYVVGRVHTNGLENFWSLLKRSLDGTYVAVAPEHLQRYCDEQVFRFNKRKGNDSTRFLEAMLATPGKRLTWKALTETGG